MSKNVKTVTIDYQPNAKQCVFHASPCDEVLYGGAKGGGKSCALVMDALAYGLEFPKATIYLFRETYDDLEANLIKEWKEKVPEEIQKHPFNNSGHYATLKNGSVIKFRYIRNLQDAESYKGRSIDYIGIDELTNFEKKWILILLSCLRSAKGFPPTFRGTTNPGGIGHAWVKADYVDATNYGEHETRCEITGNRRAFIPATVYDNDVLMANDPNYVKRLENLPENEKKAFLYGDWNIFEGQYFSEFNKKIHVIDPFVIPSNWNKFITIDYGLDMLACYWVAIDTYNNAYVYKELYESNLIISDASKRINSMKDEPITLHYAPPDMWNRRQDTGKSASDIFAEHGLHFIKAVNDRVQGWYNLKEWLKVIEVKNEQTGEMYKTSRLKITSNCHNLIRCLPQLQYDAKKPNDVATEPHELTHSCLTGDTIINTPNGDFMIKDLVDTTGDIYCYDLSTNQKTISTYKNVIKTKINAEIIGIVLEDDSVIKCTSDHPILTERGWIKAIELNYEDEIIKV